MSTLIPIGESEPWAQPPGEQAAARQFVFQPRMVVFCYYQMRNRGYDRGKMFLELKFCSSSSLKRFFDVEFHEFNDVNHKLCFWEFIMEPKPSLGKDLNKGCMKDPDDDSG